jgi:hypothetical protein
MSQADKFFQFPISALQLGKPLEEVTSEDAMSRLQEILAYSTVEAGVKFLQSKDSEAVEAVLDRSSVRCPHRKLTAHEKHVILGMYVCNFTISGGGYVQKETYLEESNSIRQLVGGGKQLRLRTDIFWQYRRTIEEGTKDIEWRDFATLCAVNAGIGAHHSSQLSFDYIGCMSIGYSSLANATSAGRRDLIPLRHKTRYTVRSLSHRGWFVYLSPNGRHNFYSNSLNESELANYMIKKVTDKSKVPKSALNAVVKEQIEQAKSEEKTRSDIIKKLESI